MRQHHPAVDFTELVLADEPEDFSVERRLHIVADLVDENVLGEFVEEPVEKQYIALGFAILRNQKQRCHSRCRRDVMPPALGKDAVGAVHRFDILDGVGNLVDGDIKEVGSDPLGQHHPAVEDDKVVLADFFCDGGAEQ